jgi:N-acetylneuraminic acid mutarotase
MKLLRNARFLILTALFFSTFGSNAAAQGGFWTTSLTPMPGGYGNFPMGTINGKIYAAGGQSGSTALATLQSYDPVNNTWSTKTSMPTARLASAAVVVNGLLYVIGGCTDNACGGVVGTVEVYDPVTDSWTTKSPMPTARRGFDAGVVNGVIYAVGGLGQSCYPCGTNEAYDPATDTWTTKAPLPTPRTARIQAVNGLLYAMGGYDGCCSQFATVDAYNPLTDAWSTKASLPSPRGGGGTGVINGTIYYAGGSGTETELVAYDPIADAWSEQTPEPSGGNSTTAASVANGLLYVLIQTGNPSPTGSPTIAFTPITNQTPSAITSNFNGTPIGARNIIWFNGVLKVQGLGTSPVTVFLTNSTIQFTANGTPYNLSVPNTTITFSPTATAATTAFDTGANTWNTTVPSSGLAGNQFLDAVEFLVPSGGLPGGIDNVTWQGTISSTAHGITVDWKWGAAVYTSFSTDYNALGVKPVDDNKASQYQNSDHAGSPENFKNFVIGGATGGGGSNWTGGYSGTANVKLP